MWMELAADYGMFLAKLGTVVASLLLICGFIVFLATRSKSGSGEHLEVRHLNENYEQMQLKLISAIASPRDSKRAFKEFKARHKSRKRSGESGTGDKRVFVLYFKGDIRASQVQSLREEISALLSVARDGDRVVVVLESGGGTVHGYGLAASQLKRIRDRGIHLTVAVDKVAASGGYMMACVADRIIAAPFAIIGSIGVLAQLPNFNRFLKRHDIDFEQIAAGKYKRTLSLFGENTEEDREHMREELEETHELFKRFVKENRSQVDLEKIATGEHWYGQQALAIGLVDELRTSDDLLREAAGEAELYQLEYVRKKPFLEKIFGSTAQLFQPQDI